MARQYPPSRDRTETAARSIQHATRIPQRNSPTRYLLRRRLILAAAKIPAHSIPSPPVRASSCAPSFYDECATSRRPVRFRLGRYGAWCRCPCSRFRSLDPDKRSTPPCPRSSTVSNTEESNPWPTPKRSLSRQPNIPIPGENGQQSSTRQSKWQMISSQIASEHHAQTHAWPRGLRAYAACVADCTPSGPVEISLACETPARIGRFCPMPAPCRKSDRAHRQADAGRRYVPRASDLGTRSHAAHTPRRSCARKTRPSFRFRLSRNGRRRPASRQA